MKKLEGEKRREKEERRWKGGRVRVREEGVKRGKEEKKESFYLHFTLSLFSF